MTTRTINIGKKYRDLFVNLDPHPETGDIVALRDEAAIRRSIKNLLQTGPYERLFQPSIKSGVQNLLFEPIDQQTTNMIKTAISETITAHEPRVSLVSVDVQAQEERNQYLIRMAFYIINRDDPISADIVLKRVR